MMEDNEFQDKMLAGLDFIKGEMIGFRTEVAGVNQRLDNLEDAVWEMEHRLKAVERRFRRMNGNGGLH